MRVETPAQVVVPPVVLEADPRLALHSDRLRLEHLHTVMHRDYGVDHESIPGRMR